MQNEQIVGTSSASNLPSITFNDRGEERVIFTLPATDSPNLNSVLVFALPKSGSVLLESMVRGAAGEVGLKYVAIMGEFFRLGLPDTLAPPSTSEIFLEKGYCYGGFRYYPTQFEIPIRDKAKKILLVRDPRDMLVSYYFSMRTSHPNRGQQLKSSITELPHREIAQSLDIDAYVLETARSFKYMIKNYQKLCTTSEVKVFRYEDVIYKKAEWLDSIVDFFGWNLTQRQIANIAQKNDIFPENEDATRHVRQVHPGNYKTKLQPATIEKLEAEFADEMQYFGYR